MITGPTPTENTLPLRITGFSTLAEALDYAAGERLDVIFTETGVSYTQSCRMLSFESRRDRWRDVS